MRRGGIYDHIGRGFSIDIQPIKDGFTHFEKMLYDQAMRTNSS